MASLLDISLLQYFSNVFVILFIFAASYAILTFKNPFGANKGVNALIAATIALIFIFSQDAIAVVRNSVPWFVVIMVLLMFVVMVTAAFGSEIPATIGSNMGTYILVISVIILVINLAHQLGQQVGPYLPDNRTVEPGAPIPPGQSDVGTGDFATNFGATLFHPKVLALMLVMIVALFAVLWIGYVP
jgi:hypothetical protein